MKIKPSQKRLTPTSGKISYAVQVSQSPWQFSNRSCRAAIDVLLAGGYKNLAEKLGDYLRVEKIPFDKHS